jgi:hypothetical protein
VTERTVSRWLKDNLLLVKCLQHVSLDFDRCVAGFSRMGANVVCNLNISDRVHVGALWQPVISEISRRDLKHSRVLDPMLQSLPKPRTGVTTLRVEGRQRTSSDGDDEQLPVVPVEQSKRRSSATYTVLV